MSLVNLFVGGVEISIFSSLDLEQSYDPQSARYRQRMGDGSMRQTVAWSGKLRTEITARGPIPIGLSSVDFNHPVVIKCAQPLAIDSQATSISLPTARRTDTAPFVRVEEAGRWRVIDSTLVGDVISFSSVPNATKYQAVYWPELLVFADEPRQSGDVRGADFGWSLAGDEV